LRVEVTERLVGNNTFGEKTSARAKGDSLLLAAAAPVSAALKPARADQSQDVGSLFRRLRPLDAAQF
jgi:hypothetical protein